MKKLLVIALGSFSILAVGCGDDSVTKTSPNTWYIDRSALSGNPAHRLDETCASEGKLVKEIIHKRFHDLIVICEP